MVLEIFKIESYHFNIEISFTDSKQVYFKNLKDESKTIKLPLIAIQSVLNEAAKRKPIFEQLEAFLNHLYFLTHELPKDYKHESQRYIDKYKQLADSLLIDSYSYQKLLNEAIKYMIKLY